MESLEAKLIPVMSGTAWQECPLSVIINDIVAGKNRAADAIDCISKVGKAAHNLSKSMADPNQWVHGHDELGNEAYYCENGSSNATISVLELPAAYKERLAVDYRFAKYIVINQNIDGFSSQHGTIWWAVKATEGITDLVFGTFALIKVRNLVQLGNAFLHGERVAGAAAELELNAELQAPLMEIPEVAAELEVDAAVAFEWGAVAASVTGIMFAVMAIVIVGMVVEFFLLQDYNSLLLVVNLSAKEFAFKPAYLDNVDAKHLPEPLQPDSKSNMLPAFVRAARYDPLVGFKPDEPFAHMALLSFVNGHTFLEGLGTLLKFTDTSSSSTNFLSLYEVNRLQHNRQGLAIDYSRDDFKDYYDDNAHKQSKDRLDVSGSGLRLISQTSELSGASQNVYKTVLIVLDA